MFLNINIKGKKKIKKTKKKKNRKVINKKQHIILIEKFSYSENSQNVVRKCMHIAYEYEYITHIYVYI